MHLLGLLLILTLYYCHPCLVESAGISGVELTQLSPQQTPCPGEVVVYLCTVPGDELRWRLLGENGDRITDPSVTEIDQNGFRSTAGVYDVANNCFNSTLTFSAQNGTSFICLNRDQSMNESVTVAVQENDGEQCATSLPTPTLTPIPTTTASATPTQPPTQSQPPPTTGPTATSGSSAGAIAGGTIGGLIFIILIILIDSLYIWFGTPRTHPLNYAVKAPADASGKVPEAEPPVLYSTVKTED